MSGSRDGIEWLQTADGRFDVEVRNQTGEVLVHPADVDSVTIWSAVLDRFHWRESTIALVNDGRTLVHVLGKHAVSELNDAAVYVIERDGLVIPIAARHFTPEVVAVKRRYAGQPRYTWYTSLIEITDDHITLFNAVSERRSVDYGGILASFR